MTLNDKQRSNAAKMLINMGTVTFATGVIGAAVKAPFSPLEFLTGIAAPVMCLILVLYIER